MIIKLDDCIFYEAKIDRQNEYIAIIIIINDNIISYYFLIYVYI